MNTKKLKLVIHLGPFNVSNFFSSYVSVLFFAILFAYHKIAHKTKWVPLKDMDLDTDFFRPPPEEPEVEKHEKETKPRWRRWVSKSIDWLM
jgi:amino acid permease